MKKAVSLFLALVLCLGGTIPALAMPYGQEYQGYEQYSSQQYSDVVPEHWAYASIETCSQRSWFNGYPDGTFRPNNLITREEAAKVFAVAMGLSIESDPTVTFTDTANNWARAYIEATKPLFPNVANLQGTNSFRPTQTITREETIYALVVAWGYGSKAKNADLSILNMFSDARSISAGVKPYLAVAVSEGLVAGLPDGTIAAQKGLTRAEFATLLARALSHGYGDTTTEFEAPEITLYRYESTTQEESIVVSGRVSPVSGVALTLDGDKVSVGRDGKFEVTLPLEEGSNTFTLTATNAYGVEDQAIIEVERTPKDVSIEMVSTVPEQTEQSQVTATGMVANYSDDCVLLLDGKMVAVDGNGFFELALDLAEGRNQFTLTVMRRNQEVARKSLEIVRLVADGAGQWLGSLPEGVTEELYNIETKEQYRVQTREEQVASASSLSGWTLIKKDGSWGNWSGWQDSAVSGSDTRKVETRQVETSPATTRYRYWAYSGKLNAAGAKLSGVTAGVGGTWRHFSESWMKKYTSSYEKVYTPWLDSPLSPVPNWTQTSGGVTAHKYRYDGQVFYLEITEKVAATYKTQYRYQDYTARNTFERWTDWSEWSDAARSADDNTRVETRTLYRFTAK